MPTNLEVPESSYDVNSSRRGKLRSNC